MKFLNKLFLISLSVMLLSSCTDEFEEINTNPTSPAQVPGDFLFTNVQWNSQQQGFWVREVLHLGNWMQHYGNQNSGFTMAHYFDRGQDMAGFWNDNYDLLFDLTKAVEEIDAQDGEGEFANVKKAVIEIQAVQIWYYMTQMLGDIPYSEALQPEQNTSPVYDPQENIIADLFNRLDAAISTLQGASIAAFGGADIFYGGEPQQWVKYGNSLMLKMAMGIENGDPSLASQRAGQALQGPLLESTADNAVLPTDNGGPAFRHPMWNLDGLATSDRPLLGETFVNTLISTNDPRLPIIASPTERSVAAGSPEFKGVPAAPDDALYGEINANLDDFSFPNSDWMSGRATNYDKGINRMTFAEISFYKAEAVLKGYGAGDAQQFFEEGIRAAMTVAPFTDAGLTEDQINSYIAENGTLTGSESEQLEQIHTQLWIQHFMDQEYDAYLDWRRSGFPQLIPGPNPGETSGVIPRRFKYSENEPVVNEASYNAAVGGLSQGDSYLSRVWSDQ
ncbi:MAG: SusD/RagB family nutrient-binding outer membrane lipoprotein [Bacteroidota bacterium]